MTKRNSFHFFLLTCFLLLPLSVNAQVIPGIDRLFTESNYQSLLRGKKIGLITNQTAIDSRGRSSIDLLIGNSQDLNYQLVALFAPEHGISGAQHSWELIQDGVHTTKIPIHSLHGKTFRPTDEMLQGIDLLVFDIQDIGSRSYTYLATLFYVMEEAAARKIPVVVADRPNPINGVMVDGPLLEEKWRSVVGYVNVPYCYGMTIGEMALYFNKEYNVNCNITVVPLKGWNRRLSFSETGLQWIPTSPNIPEPTTTYYYPMTGILGELQIVNIGIGFTLPFKLVGAPWIDPDSFALHLNKQNLPGVRFHPFSYKPFYGTYASKDCHGVLIQVTNPLTFKPVATQYVIMGLLKSLYPKEFNEVLSKAQHRRDMFHKVNGTEKVYQILVDKPYVAWELRSLGENERKEFMKKRKKYLLPEYGKDGV